MCYKILIGYNTGNNPIYGRKCYCETTICFDKYEIYEENMWKRLCNAYLTENLKCP